MKDEGYPFQNVGSDTLKLFLWQEIMLAADFKVNNTLVGVNKNYKKRIC